MCDLAIADITKAIEYNPKFANHYLLRGSAFYRKDDYTAAIADYTKAIEINPQSASAYNGLGNANYSLFITIAQVLTMRLGGRI